MLDDGKFAFPKAERTALRPFLLTTIILLVIFVVFVRHFGWQR